MVIEDSVALTCIFLFWPLVLIDSRFQLASYDKSDPSKIKQQIHVALNFLIIAKLNVVYISMMCLLLPEGFFQFLPGQINI